MRTHKPPRPTHSDLFSQALADPGAPIGTPLFWFLLKPETPDVNRNCAYAQFIFWVGSADLWGAASVSEWLFLF